ncbi:hypothetical protein F4803DRAFT_574082 [Xylaria telfairii]|nr:hypothetical protein F4803DRAFT_574082 [Xylaria telfairii]
MRSHHSNNYPLLPYAASLQSATMDPQAAKYNRTSQWIDSMSLTRPKKRIRDNDAAADDHGDNEEDHQPRAKRRCPDAPPVTSPTMSKRIGSKIAFNTGASASGGREPPVNFKSQATLTETGLTGADAQQMLDSINEILLEAEAATNNNVHEDYWNHMVNTPILRLVFNKPGKLRQSATTRIIPASSAHIAKDSLPFRQSPGSETPIRDNYEGILTASSIP